MTIASVNPTPIECKPITLVPPPHHLGLDVGKIHPPSGALTSGVSPIFENNHVFSPIVYEDITSFLGPRNNPHQGYPMDYLDGPTPLFIGPRYFISMGSVSPPRHLLVIKKDDTSINHALMWDIFHQPMVPIPTTMGVSTNSRTRYFVFRFSFTDAWP